jgi:hypothetical protein
MAFDSQVRKRLGLEAPGTVGPSQNIFTVKARAAEPRHWRRQPVLAQFLGRRAQPMPSLRDLAIVFGESSRRLRAWLSNATDPPFRINPSPAPCPDHGADWGDPRV